jgi:aspartyl-tRNA(Asn)/glutamyl-tRNA(Gln) amidotransferase subunit C
VAVSDKDVLHVASLARLAVDPARLVSLVSELNGILGHMDVLGRVETGRGMWEVGGGTTATPMRPDVDGMPVSLVAPRESFAPEMRDGFFLVPRLETHDGEGERTP